MQKFLFIFLFLSSFSFGATDWTSSDFATALDMKLTDFNYALAISGVSSGFVLALGLLLALRRY